MKTHHGLLLLAPAVLVLSAVMLTGHPEDDSNPVNSRPAAAPSRPGANRWNAATEPTNWWHEIQQVHGHVGPWNVLGWRMGQTALRELHSTWGQHELDVVCHIPVKMPCSCLADGLVVGTGNSIGRLDLRLAEVMTLAETHVSIRRKDGTGPVLLLTPNVEYLKKIGSEPEARLESLAHECGELPEADLFAVQKVEASDLAPVKN